MRKLFYHFKGLLFIVALLFATITTSAQLPLEPTREISFETDEGTWLSLDISPDGKTIIFELLGDIYELPIEGGKAKLLAGGMAFESQPTYSPDGKKITFISDRSGEDQLWISDANGTNPLQISSTYGLYASPAWSADGKSIFVASGLPTRDIFMYNVASGDRVLITDYEGAGNFRTDLHSIGAAVSPDDKYLYFAQKEGMVDDDARFPTWEIKRHDLSNDEEITFLSVPGSAFRPQVSPDGKLLAYGTRLDNNTALRIRNLETGDDRILIFPIERDEQESRYTRDVLPRYAFTPNSEEILISQHGKITSVSTTDGSKKVIPFTAQVTQSLGPLVRYQEPINDDTINAKLIMAPRLSPNGKKLIFSSFGHIYIMDYPSGAPSRLTNSDSFEYQPSWSPDGKWIAYVTWNKSKGYLWKMKANGTGDPIRLTEHPAFFSDPVWSPNGKNIIALKGSAYLRTLPFQTYLCQEQLLGTEIISISTSDGEIKSIAPAQGKNKPHFNAKGDRIYLTSRGDMSSARLNSLDIQGNDSKKDIELNDTYMGFFDDSVIPPEIMISPDEDWVLAKIGLQLYLTTLTSTYEYIDITNTTHPYIKLSTYGADYFAWADGGETVIWSVGSSLFKVSIADLISEKTTLSDFEPNIQEIDIKVELPPHNPKGTILLTGAQIITMNKNEVFKDGDILIKNNRIAAIGPKGSLQIPKGTHTIDVSGKTIMPGIVDSHNHWGIIRPDILETDGWVFRAMLSYGVTTSFDAQSDIADYLGYEDLADAGEILAPRLFSTGPLISYHLNYSSKEDISDILIKYREYYKTPNLKLWLAGQRNIRQLIAMKSKELNGTPTNCGNRDAKMDLTHAMDGFGATQHNLPISPLYKDVVELFAQSGTAISPTLMVTVGGPWGLNYFLNKYDIYEETKLVRFSPKHYLDARAKRFSYYRDEEHFFPSVATDLNNIVKAGGLVSLGSHSMLHGLGSHWEMWALSMGGMEPMEVIRASTISSAIVIGRATDLGSLEVGKMADLIVLDKNPLDDIHNTNTVKYVMRNGELFEAETLDQIWPDKKSLSPMGFWEYQNVPNN